MLPVFICSSNNKNLQIYKQIVSTFGDRNSSAGIRIVCCSTNPKDVLRLLKLRHGPALYCLDVFGGKSNNFLLAQSIREHDPRAYIIILSSAPDYSQAIESNMEFLAYIDKNAPDIVEQLYSSLFIVSALHKRVTSLRHCSKCLLFLPHRNIA